MSSNDPRPTAHPDHERARFLAREGFLLTADLDPDDKRRVLRWCKQGHLKRLMRGLYVVRDAGRMVIVRAVARAYPNAVFVGETAAWLNGQIDFPPRVITAAHTGRSHTFGAFRLIRSEVPDEGWFERDGLRRMNPIMAAVDVIPRLGAGLVDSLMRSTRDAAQATDRLRRLVRCLTDTPRRVGNPSRRRVVDRTATVPWSEAERTAHDLLDAAGITGWTANTSMTIKGQEIHPDICFERERLVLEIDGFQYHSSQHAFVRDRRRQNLLVLDGWRVLRFTWQDLSDRPDRVLADVHEALFH